MTLDSVVHAGNTVRVRLGEGEAPPPTPTPQLAHKVKAGDTAFGIALQYGLTLEELLAYNGISANTLLQIGQELVLRPPTPTPEPTVTATPTFTPVPVSLAVAAKLETPTPRPEPTAVAMVEAPDAGEGGPDWGTIFGIGALIVGLGLTVVAGIAVIALWRK